MQVETSHHIDCSEIDSEGYYEYFYEYDLIRFSDGPMAFIVRSYADTAEEASFLRAELGGVPRGLTREDLSLPLFRCATEHLWRAGKRSVMWLGPQGYTSLS